MERNHKVQHQQLILFTDNKKEIILATGKQMQIQGFVKKNGLVGLSNAKNLSLVPLV